jgi:hypothetical protein
MKHRMSPEDARTTAHLILAALSLALIAWVLA